MLKHRWRELTKKFASHVDPERTEQLRRNKADIEANMARILKLIKNEDQGKREGKRKASKKESELVGLIDKFYKEYQSLYALYDHLIGESAKIVFGRLGKETSSMSSSSSDSEYYSSEEVDINHAIFENKTSNINQELEIANLEVAELKRKLASTNKEKEALTKDCNALSSKIQQTETINKDLRIEMDRQEREVSALVQTHEAKGKQSVARIKELESQLSGLKIEMESLRSQKREMENSRKESKANKSKQKGDKNAEIQNRVLELESMLRDREDEKSALLKELIANENNSKSKIAELMAQVSNLKLEFESLQAQNVELEEKISCKRNEASGQSKVMQKELESLKLLKDDLEMEVERKNIEISQNLILIESLKEELAKKSSVEKKSAQVKELEQQTDNLRNQKDDLEKMKMNKLHENNQLKLDKEGLIARIVELEGTLSEREEEASIQIMALTAQNDLLKQELDSLKSQKSQFELQSERDNQVSSKGTQMENQKMIKLTTGKIEDQQKINIKEEKDTTTTTTTNTRKSNKDHKQSKGRLQQNRPNQQVVERKMEDLAEKFRIGFENNIRLLYQRILVAEQLHTENRENYRKTKGKYEKQNKELEETIENYETELKKMKDISESAVSKELQIAKNWVRGTTSEIKRLRHNVDVLVAQLDDKEEQEFLLREKVWKLEAKVSKEGGEKLNLMKAITQLEKKLGKYESLIKEKDERLSSLGDEKREAIKQLCILIDYQRSRYDHLKGAFLQAQLSLRRNNRINTLNQ
ncbi:hypothetical protein FEM48_Zijuj11G0022200 [Ziziphus jujuba var. spinosa]|uniref:NAB domain-containing protein n=1 Tax=Ziziphus jujuba var. spinosa TaxID=714518 RepID=A0A978UG84_ZIZJJ|nr:hypothetical protein FEM48_Zijuj11G0022200 [Ziziphus jujuba var. spinosa]